MSNQSGLRGARHVRSLQRCAMPFRYFNGSPEVIRLTVMMSSAIRCRCGRSKICCPNAGSISLRADAVLGEPVPSNVCRRDTASGAFAVVTGTSHQARTIESRFSRRASGGAVARRWANSVQTRFVSSRGSVLPSSAVPSGRLRANSRASATGAAGRNESSNRPRPARRRRRHRTQRSGSAYCGARAATRGGQSQDLAEIGLGGHLPEVRRGKRSR